MNLVNGFWNFFGNRQQDLNNLFLNPYTMGRKLPKKYAYYKRRASRGSNSSSKFPDCIGKYTECENYTKDMDLEDRPECKTCPFRD